MSVTASLHHPRDSERAERTKQQAGRIHCLRSDLSDKSSYSKISLYNNEL
jgi:hypothetical protein